ncbi:sensor histidine kinase [Brevibacillus dissolubilis]|uniref:sensor histidine kinase n=1 Tax=Brevibacillus dissolubilis TaxID=1844116 RepID=UPI001115C7F9|nr:HAMP domain-containing sensor histidine kinase [Brevibacillus dissolubilis]
MSIRKRLILSNIGMIVVPLVLFLLAASLLSLVYQPDWDEFPWGDRKDGPKRPPAPEFMLHQELREQTFVNPEKYLNQSYLKKIDTRLKKTDNALIVRKADKLIYTSPSLPDIQELELPSFNFNERGRPMYEIGGKTYAVMKHDFYFRDGSQGSIMFVKEASPVEDFAWTFYPVLFLLLIGLLVLTNSMLTYFVSRSIVRPIDQLKEAAQQISEGNLDFRLEATTKDELGQLTHAFEVMREKLQESIRIQLQYEENRKELIANISHDLKTPITAIKGYVEGIRDGVANTPEKLGRYVQTISTKANDLDHMIDELFLYSKLDLNRLPFEFETLNLRDYMQDYLEELQFELDKRQVQLAFDVQQGATYLVTADREKLKRVLINIVQNSLKYMDKADKRLDIWLSAKAGTDEEDGTVTLEIQDNGPGIEAENLPYIFDRFYRTDQSRNSLTGGSGLGLAIVKRIIEEHGGTIGATSQIGQGTRVIITLPQVKETEGGAL